MTNNYSIFVRRIIKGLAPLAIALTVTSTASAAVSATATEVTEVFGLPITNSMITSWVVSLAIIIVVRLMVKKPKLVPTTGQMMIESLVGGIRDMIEPIVGKRMVKPTFPLLVGLFTFILIQNWSGLFPGVGSIGYIAESGDYESLIRPGNADLNMTMALALIHFAAWLYYVFRYAGPKVLFLDLFGNKADKKETPAFMFYALSLVFFAVGIIEVVSIAFRNISLPFRLFGNVFGGENLIHAMSSLCAWVLPVPFYFLEILIGFVQALVFTLLVAVYIGLICNHDSEEHAH